MQPRTRPLGCGAHFLETTAVSCDIDGGIQRHLPAQERIGDQPHGGTAGSPFCSTPVAAAPSGVCAYLLGTTLGSQSRSPCPGQPATASTSIPSWPCWTRRLRPSQPQSATSRSHLPHGKQIRAPRTGPLRWTDSTSSRALWLGKYRGPFGLTPKTCCLDVRHEEPAADCAVDYSADLTASRANTATSL
jgi:hypothetical protein